MKRRENLDQRKKNEDYNSHPAFTQKAFVHGIPMVTQTAFRDRDTERKIKPMYICSIYIFLSHKLEKIYI